MLAQQLRKPPPPPPLPPPPPPPPPPKQQKRNNRRKLRLKLEPSGEVDHTATSAAKKDHQQQQQQQLKQQENNPLQLSHCATLRFNSARLGYKLFIFITSNRPRDFMGGQWSHLAPSTVDTEPSATINRNGIFLLVDVSKVMAYNETINPGISSAEE